MSMPSGLHLHNGFHCSCSLLGQTIAVLHLYNLAACFFNAFLVAGQTCLVGLVTLYAGNDQYGRLVDALCLGCFNRCGTAALGCILITGADKCQLFSPK